MIRVDRAELTRNEIIRVAANRFLNDGYTKNHTLYHGTDYSGFFNIKYKKVDSFTIEFVIDGISYSFTF